MTKLKLKWQIAISAKCPNPECGKAIDLMDDIEWMSLGDEIGDRAEGETFCQHCLMVFKFEIEGWRY